MEGLVDGSLRVEREASINLSGDLSGDDLEDLLAELNKQTVEGGIDLLVESLALSLTLGNSGIDEAGVLGLLGGGEDQGGVGGSILRLVLANGGEVTGVADDDLN